MTTNKTTPGRRAGADAPPRRFGIRRPDGQWYSSRADLEDQHRWGPARSAGVWTTKQYADAALHALKPALRADGYTAREVDDLEVARLPVIADSLAASPYLPDFDALRLTTIGSRNVSIDVTPSPLAENADGVTLWLALHDEPLAIALTATQATILAAWLTDTVKTQPQANR